MSATGLVLSGVVPAGWYLVRLWRRGQRTDQSALAGPRGSRAEGDMSAPDESNEAQRRQADELSRAELKRARARHRERFRRWEESELPLLITEEYPTLLCDGTVEPAKTYCDEDEWFTGIRARAEADGLRVELIHTWSRRRDDEVEPWAVLVSPTGEPMPRLLGTRPGHAERIAAQRAWIEAQWGDTLIRARIRAARSRC
jgi:hypothetical protein